ncbi:MAG: kinase [Gammaproteobacteria bacterium]|jgi:NAD+ kinase|nr:kinase [Gammaproteobacteria bacterium]
MPPNPAFKRIALMGRQRQNGTYDTLITLHDYLVDKGYAVVFEKETAEHVSPQKVNAVASDELSQTSDIIIVVGGDGSLLHAAQIAIDQSLPILGVNRGRLGFLTDMHPNNLPKIEEVLNGHYHEEPRFLLRAEVLKKEEAVAYVEGLNEVVLFPSDVAHMIDFDIMINQQSVCSLRADGLIIATPTGSTAYALSGGGPILHPELNAVAMVPMFPHTLTNRPIVVSADSHILINISHQNTCDAYASADGQRRVQIEVGDRVHIHKKSAPLRLIHPLDYSYFDTLRAKLHWQKGHA